MIPNRQTIVHTPFLVVSGEGVVRCSSEETQDLVGLREGSSVPEAVLRQLAEGAKAALLSSDSAELEFSVWEISPDSGWLLIGRSPSPACEDVSAVPGSEEMAYRAFFEQAPVGIAHLSEEGRVTFENHALREIVGERAEDTWLGRHFSEIPLLTGFVAPLIDGVLKSGSSFDGSDAEVLRASGEVRNIRIIGSPIRNSDGDVAGGVLTVQDITEARLAEELSRRARVAAEESSRIKSALIATISHELRTPAGTIHGFASMLRDELRNLGEDGVGSGVPLEFAEAIATRAEDLVRLVGDLTELSQLETGSVALQLADVDVAELLVDCVKTVAAKPGAVPVRVVGCRNVVARADRQRLRHALERILANALKFTTEGHVEVGCRPVADRVCIEVVDTGIGIDDDVLDEVFAAFSQEAHPLRRQHDGAGLGLAIVRRVIELMAGRVEIESEKGVGTTVRLYLPVSEPGSDSGARDAAS